MQVKMNSTLKLVSLLLVVGALNGQEVNNETAGSFIKKDSKVQMEKSLLGDDPVFIVEGYIVYRTQELEFLSLLNSSEIEDVIYIPREEAKMHFNGPKAQRNGIVIVSLNKKSKRIWKRNLKKVK